MYGWIKKTKLELEDVECYFDTSSEIAQNWFFPRYSGGVVHEIEVLKILKEHLSRESVFFDIGANHRVYSVFAASLASRGAVHSFELDPVLIPEIVKNREFNELKNIWVNCCAVSDRSGEVTAFQPDDKTTNRRTNTMMDQHNDDAYGVQIVSITLDFYCEAVSVTPEVLKIDVEGLS